MVVGESADFLSMIVEVFSLVSDTIRDWVLILVTVGIVLLLLILITILMAARIT